MLSIITLLLPYIMKVLEKVIPDADTLNEVKRSLEQTMLENQAAIFGGMRDVMVADGSSLDWYTSRARPTVVYWSISCITLIAVLGVFGLADPVLGALKAVPDKLWDLMTYGIGAFVLGRTGEKIASDYFSKKAG